MNTKAMKRRGCGIAVLAGGETLLAGAQSALDRTIAAQHEAGGSLSAIVNKCLGRLFVPPRGWMKKIVQSAFIMRRPRSLAIFPVLQRRPLKGLTRPCNRDKAVFPRKNKGRDALSAKPQEGAHGLHRFVHVAGYGGPSD